MTGVTKPHKVCLHKKTCHFTSLLYLQDFSLILFIVYFYLITIIPVFTSQHGSKYKYSLAHQRGTNVAKTA